MVMIDKTTKSKADETDNMKKLYLMRHGETLFNKLGKIQGASDSP